MIKRGTLLIVSENKKRRPNRPPLFNFRLSATQFLELEAQTNLHLPLAVERAARFGNRCEGSVEGQRRTVQRVNGLVQSGDLGAIEKVKRFAQKLEVHFLLDIETSGDSQINVLHIRPRKSVARDQRQAVGTAARAVEAAAWSAG